MPNFNIHQGSIEKSYEEGLLPQRNDRYSFYQDSSCRCDLSQFSLSSENRRILTKTQAYNFSVIPINEFTFDIEVQKQIFKWIKTLNWDFPISSVKNIFQNHIFNYLYIWTFDSKVVAYSLCYISPSISHIAYVFYDPEHSHRDLPIRLSLQVIIDSHQKGLQYCYLGRFNPETKLGYYKRNFPGFQFYKDSSWLKFK